MDETAELNRVNSEAIRRADRLALRFVAAILLVVIAFAFSGCGGSGGDQQGTTVIDQKEESCNG
jgi:hypothetical protein